MRARRRLLGKSGRAFGIRAVAGTLTRSTSSRPGCVFIIDKEDTMPHDINQMVYVGREPWHGLGTPLPANGSYEEIVHAAGFYTAVERPLHSPPMEGPIPDKLVLVGMVGRVLGGVRV